ncbi:MULTISPECIES: TniQ family protein [unclassified Burkholderia]|uniref:TniQ family protein n=1 Tax=unclassified Burkholderia TaxID=2613784 RepID=UPI002AB0597B|nr:MULTISPECIES: TniQ family protein [unclassified Burkholderia]
MTNKVDRAQATSARSEPQRLFMHPVIHVGEASVGFLMRAANANGIKLSGLKRLGIAFDPAILAKALSWDRVAPPEGSMRYVAELAALRQAVPSAWLSSSARCCPACLREQSYWSSEWELRQYVACSIHKCWLIDRCGVCEKKILRSRKALLQCDCGTAFADGQIRPSPSKFVEISELIASKLPGKRIRPTSFDALSFADLVEMLFWFVTWPTDLVAGAQRRYIFLEDLQTAIPIIEPCADLFSSWPSGYLARLRAMHLENGDETGSINTTFSEIYRRVALCRNVKCAEVLIPWFQQYLIDNWPWPVLERGNEITNAIVSRLPWMWASTAARHLGVKEVRVRKFARDGVVESKVRPFTKGRMLMAVRRDELPKMRRMLQDQATTHSLNSLGISWRRRPVLVPLLFPAAGYPASGWLLDQSEVRNVLRIADGLPVVDRVGDSQVVLERVLRSCAWRNVLVERLFRLIFDGAVKPEAVLSGKRGFTGWLFDRRSLDRIKNGESILGL